MLKCGTFNFTNSFLTPRGDEKQGQTKKPHLKDSEDGSWEGIKIGGWSLILKVEPEETEKS